MKNTVKTFAKHLLYQSLPPALSNRIRFLIGNGYWPKLKDPRSFNELLLVRKLSKDSIKFAEFADKVHVRKHVSQIIGSKYLVRQYATSKSAEQMDLAKLPNRFVLKFNNDTGSIKFVRDKNSFSRSDLLNFAEEKKNEKFANVSNELFYDRIDPQIIAEEDLSEICGNVPDDIKIYVFHGKAAFIQIDFDRFVAHSRNLYLSDGKCLKVRYMYANKMENGHLSPTNVGQQLKNFDELIWCAERLGSGFDFVRVDLYDLGQHGVRFGELTFVPQSSYGKFTPSSFDFHLGKIWLSRTEHDLSKIISETEHFQL